MSGSTSPFLVAALLAVCAAATRADAQGTRVESIRISATIAAPVEGLTADALAPEMRPLVASHVGGSRVGDRSSAPDAAAEPTAMQQASRAGVQRTVAPREGERGAAPRRYRVVVRLAAAGALPAGIAIILADAEGREQALEPGRAVTIARGLIAWEARAAVVHLRVRDSAGEDASAQAIPLVYEVTSESALAM